ncbi:multiubiquitin domain-containing protein [Pedobacter boryungensis]|uniref:Multiubiquitin domain-containing protein n=1 Tax=Pedobacter boryungensis TaxID=869962 RepID=A0ABX2DDM2_9SPHI|nr:multiubiquitin domain-containing protein [Pedobacter boryungensis]NQX31644.1 multiubiquitin domain-containing protein [Pedobacter boryungensis]
MQKKNNNQEKGADKNEMLPFIVDGVKYYSSEQYITNAQIRKIAGAPEDSLESKLFLAVQRPWEDELIENEPVNLARPEIEHFYIKNILQLVINGKHFVWDKQYITGKEIKELGGISLEDELYLSIRKPWEDELVENHEEINLARPGIEHFVSKSKKHVKLIIQTPKGKWENSFLLTITVQELIQQTTAHFAFATDGNYELKIKGTTETLEKARIIGSYGFPDGQVLVFTDLGKGA